MAQTIAEKRDVAAIVEDELKRVNAPMLRQEIQGLSRSITAMGVIEALFGIFAIGLPFLTGTFFVALLGGLMLGGGILQLINGIAHNSGGRFFLGLIGAVAGALVIAHPIFGLAFLTTLIGIYLIGLGITRLSIAGKSGWEIFGGIADIVLGILVIAAFPRASAYLIGLIVGVNLIIGGISSIGTGQRLGQAVARRQQGMAYKA